MERPGSSFRWKTRRPSPRPSAGCCATMSSGPASATLRRKQLLVYWVEYHADDGLPAMGKRQAHREVGNAVDIVGRAVEWIGDPAVLGIAVERRGFLAYEAVIGHGLFEDLANGVLRGEIGLGHEVGGPFFACLEPTHPVQQSRSAGPASSPTSPALDCDGRSHHRASLPCRRAASLPEARGPTRMKTSFGS